MAKRRRAKPGFCSSCFVVLLPPESELLTCEGCRAYEKQKYQEKKRSGVCVACKGKRTEARTGVLCTSCYERRRDERRENLDDYKVVDKVKRDFRREAGLCTNCGSGRDNPDFKYCTRCRNYHRDLKRAMRQEAKACQQR